MEETELKTHFDKKSEEWKNKIWKPDDPGYYESMKLVKEGKIIPTVLKITNYIDNVERFYERHPFFYDKSGIFWFWNKTECKYEIIDEVDVMNAIDKELQFGGETVTGGVKNNYLEAFKRVGRLHHPAEAPVKWIQFKDKAFSLKSGNIYDVKPNYFFCNPIPHEIGKTDETPIMDKLFEEWVGKGYVQSMYEMIAYCCYRNYPIQTLFCLYGIGRNGKTCFLRLLSKFIGKENLCSTDLDLLVGNNRSRFESFKMYKRMVCLMGETNFGILNNSAILKKLVGGDLIGFEVKGGKTFDDYNYAKIIIASNSLPTTEDTSEGFYRRWMIIDFPNQFSEGKDILKTIPEEEYKNLANKITKILPNLIENGYFTNQGSIDERKDRYIMASNPLPYFLKNFCVEGPEEYIRYSEAYIKYTKFLSASKRRVVSRKEFSKLLSIEGLENRKTSKEGNIDYYIEGIRFKENFLDFLNFHNFPLSYIRENTDRRNTEIREIKEKPKPQELVCSTNEPKDIVGSPKNEETIYHKCSICGTDTADLWTKQGKPICFLCNGTLDANSKENA